MTDQLHELLAGIADRAGAGPNDPTLWDRARRARRDQRRLRAGAVAALVAAVLAGLTLAGAEQSRRSAPPAVEQPDRPDGPAIPSVIYGVPGDGGLELERDLGVGRAAVVLTNAAGAFVVTAEDGVYHRVRLAGFHPELQGAGLGGLALSPDGRQLVWTWQGPPGPEGSDYAWGLRVADLTTGDVRTVRVAVSFNPGVLANMRWSPDSRHVVMDKVWAAGLEADWVPPPDADYAVERWGVVLDTRTLRWKDMFSSYGDGSPYDPWIVSPAGRAYRVVADRLRTWEGDRPGRVGPRSTVATGLSGLSTGRFSPDGRWLLLSGRNLSSGLALVDVARPGGGPLEVALPRTGSVLDVQGWTDDRRALALLHSDVTEADGAALVRLTLVPAPADLASGTSGALQVEVEDVGLLLGTADVSSVSIATVLAAGDRGTWDADAPPFAPDVPALSTASTASTGSEPAADSGGGPTIALGTVAMGVAGAAAAVLALLLLASRARRRRGHGAGRT